MVTMNNGKDYVFEAMIDGISYFMPEDEFGTIRVRDRLSGVEADTDFYEMADMELREDGSRSYHTYVMHEGVLMCNFDKIQLTGEDV